MAETKPTKDGVAEKEDVVEVNAASVPEGACAVDIRIFLLAITFCMSAAFFAGVSINLGSLVDLNSFVSVGSSHKKQIPPNLELLPVQMAASDKHSPSGQHLLVDIEGIEAAFLDSEERLSNAMVRTVQEAGLTMLSYHCHKLSPAGISCVGVLLESHISFHTWPEEGVITLDLFTCGPKPLLPVVSVILRLFGIGENVNVKWSHELRGVRSWEERKANYLDDMSDLSMWVLSPAEIHTKRQVYSNLTKFQRVDIWELSEVSKLDRGGGLFGCLVLTNLSLVSRCKFVSTKIIHLISTGLNTIFPMATRGGCLLTYTHPIGSYSWMVLSRVCIHLKSLIMRHWSTQSCLLTKVSPIRKKFSS
jgi:S-adenosylmethionine decarboxylase proenzyme